jgi:putative Holliday junction resolvase
MKFLGLDWGKAKIGIALGDDETKIASPIMILNFHNLSEVEKKLSILIIDEQIGAFVVGKPLSLAGEESFSQSFNQFVEIIESFGLPVFFEDERMSTKYAAVLKRDFKGCKKVGDDDLAATAILQSYFDRTR